MASKVYQKRGNLNYKERNLIRDIEQALSKKYTEEELKDFRPATTYEELQELHSQYCGEEVEFEEVKNDKGKEETSNASSSEANDTDVDDTDDNSSFIDPLNREEPIVRDYVMEEGGKAQETSGKTNFDEPLTLDEQFELPDDNIGGDKNNTSKREEGNKSGANNNNQQSNNSQPRQEPAQSKSDKKRQMRFAKYIVEAVCVLLEKGFVWWTTKDINDSKLAEYELSGEMNLDVMVTLENNQEVAIKHFFKQQCVTAEGLSKVSPEEKEDLTEALYEYLNEKQIKATASQELLLIAGKIVGEKAVTAIALNAQSKSLLNQLRAMKKGEEEAGDFEQQYREPYHQQNNEQQNNQQQTADEGQGINNDTTEEDDEKFLLESQQTRE